MSHPVRVRFAPSPTGRLHIGGARTALFNWAFARHHGGQFILRVEDTDRERSNAEFETAILEGMQWLGMDWDEGPLVGGEFAPYRQSERLDSHLSVAETLESQGVAYRCFCKPERLAELREKQIAAKQTAAYDGLCTALSREDVTRKLAAGEASVLRFRVPDGETRFVDEIRGKVRFANIEVDDWIMLRADGSPTYNFVVVCDDSAMQITHVIRGEEHLSNTPKQILLYQALGLEAPTFAHLPLILGTDKKKLSKRTGDTALDDYRAKGYPPEAVMNFLCLQGWALDGETEVFSIEELTKNFEISAVSKGGSIFDMKKFLWLAGEYAQKGSLDQLVERAKPFMIAAGSMTEAELLEREAWFKQAVASVQERVRIYSEIPEQLAYLFSVDDKVVFDEKATKNALKRGTEAMGKYLDWLRPMLEKPLDVDGLRSETREWIETNGYTFPDLFQPLRCALTGAAGGPDLFDVMNLLGSSSSLARIESGLQRFDAMAAEAS
ncbi:MAG: glutamyl-tRNA synthetase [Planctomycetota bacterium]|jgi:glutamyl-tRNA synthetase